MIGISIAGFDPSGGAGILADMKTFSSLGIHGTSVITSLTAQNPNKFFSSMPIAIDYISEQFDSIMDQYKDEISYGKTGMLYSKEIIKSVSKKLLEYNIKYVVDPVMVASSGGNLLSEGADKSLDVLLKNAMLVTPNIQEAETLSKIAINNVDDAIEASNEISKLCNVLITGGHLNGTNVLNINGEISIIKNKLIDTNNIHGSGCCLSAAITSYLIKGETLKIAI
ncbi:MAG: bifunctional hydroxymethylpyrimidine kinase/phosphomethylpyrimidine kinase, partial [Methanobrevibacter sp.]|nr:bifunctional hydroxymethylpyrimidine kinase/phosphomethylpyrimidine kinase [Methanobrevibacter sp.]